MLRFIFSYSLVSHKQNKQRNAHRSSKSGEKFGNKKEYRRLDRDTIEKIPHISAISEEEFVVAAFPLFESCLEVSQGHCAGIDRDLGP